MVMPSVESLRRYSLFSGVKNGVLTALARDADVITVREGECLFEEGELADTIYVVLSGAIDLKMPLNHERIEHVDLERLVEGDVVGCSALVEPYAYALGAVAAQDSSLLAMNTKHLRRVMDENPEVGYRIETHLSTALRRRLGHMHVRFVSLLHA